MAYTEYRQMNIGGRRLALIDKCNEIIEEYQAQGYTLTLRQLYYQLVSRDIVPNEQRIYKWVGSVLSDGRYAGLVDWDAIEDRVRQAVTPTQFDSLDELVQAALSSYKLPRWGGQESYVELWVEKDALAGVLEPLARKYHITLMVNRGYSSSSAMHVAAQRFIDNDDKETYLFYLGDHDPSGLDMVRDIGARLEEFGAYPTVEHIALTTDQVAQYNPPPNPTKVTDSRASGYIAEHGRTSWEVDALPPNVLNELIQDAVEPIIDQEALDAILQQEENDKKRLRFALESLNGEEP